MLRKQILLVLLSLLVATSWLKAQTFEGWITYKTEAQNPRPEKVSNTVWMEGVRQQFGEKGYFLQKYFYSQGKYFSEIDVAGKKGYQLYNGDDKFIYSWQEGADTATTQNSKRYRDKILEVIAVDRDEEILGIPCKSLLIKSKQGEMTLWYNPSFFKMDPKLFKSHDYGLWNKILKQIECLPLKMEQKGNMINITQTAIAYEETKLDEAMFKIPTFKKVVEN